MAEREGFEPSIQCYPYTRLAGRQTVIKRVVSSILYAVIFIFFVINCHSIYIYWQDLTSQRVQIRGPDFSEESLPTKLRYAAPRLNLMSLGGCLFCSSDSISRTVSRVEMASFTSGASPRR